MGKPAPLVTAGFVALHFMLHDNDTRRANCAAPKYEAATPASAPPVFPTAIPVEQVPQVFIAAAKHWLAFLATVALGVAVLVVRARCGLLATVLLLLQPSGTLGPRRKDAMRALAVGVRLTWRGPVWAAAMKHGCNRHRVDVVGKTYKVLHLSIFCSRCFWKRHI